MKIIVCALFINVLLFMFDIIDFILKNKTSDWDNIVEYVLLQQKELQIDYFNTELITNVFQNIYHIIRF